MEVKAKICKELPVITGNGQNGAYEIHPFIVEWDEETARGAYTQSAKLEFNIKNWDVKEIAKLIGTNERIPIGISIQVDSYDGKYYNSLSGYIRDERFRVARQY